MDAAQLTRWTRFAAKGGIGKCTAIQDCVAKEPDDLMFLEDDEITVLMQLPEEDGVFLGYCEGVVGRFDAAYVRFHAKLKTPVITKRASSTSKSPHSRSSTPSHKQPLSQSPAPSLSRVSSRDSAHAPTNSPTPSVPTAAVPQLQSLPDAAFTSDAPGEPSQHDSLVAPSMSYSSSSSAQGSTSPKTPSEFLMIEPHLRDNKVPLAVVPKLPSDSDLPHVTNAEEHEQIHMERTASPVDISQQEPVASPEAPTQSPDPEPSAAAATHAAPYDPMEVVRAMSRFSDVPALHEDPPPPPSPSDSASSYGSAPHLDVDDANSVRLSRISVAMSDDVSGIGLSMLQDFISGTAEDDDSDSDSDREPASSARSSLEEAVQGFPTPPTQIPTPSSHTTSFILEAPPVRPASTHASESDYSEDPDGDGASFYDNYRYSRFSISSKMSKSSAHTGVLAPPPVPTELPPPVRRSQDSQYSAPSDPVPPAPETMPSSPLTATSPAPARPPTTRNVPPPLPLGSPSTKLRPEPLNLSTATASSPLLHTNFSSPHSSPLLDTALRSPLSPAFGSGGAASALRQRIEADRSARSSPMPSPLASATSFEQPPPPPPQSIVIEDDEADALAPRPLSQPQSPASPPVPGVPSTAAPPSEKKRGAPAPLVVMNPAPPPPPPYTPRSPQGASLPLTPASPTVNLMPVPVIPHLRPPPPQQPQQQADSPRASRFLPHPNAPKPSASPQGPLYSRAPPAPSSSSALVEALRHAAVMPLRAPAPGVPPRGATVYAFTEIELSAAVGPVPIFFSLEPPNDVPANRMRAAAAVAATAVVVSGGSSSSVGGGVGSGEAPPPPELRTVSPAPAGGNVIPRANFFPKASTARPRSRSFSGFDTALVPGAQNKERSKEEPSAPAPDASSRPSSISSRAAAHTARLQARQYTPSPLALSQAKPGAPPPAENGAAQPLPTSLPTSPSSLPTSPSSFPIPVPTPRTLTPARSEPSLRVRHSKSASTLEREALQAVAPKADAPGSKQTLPLQPPPKEKSAVTSGLARSPPNSTDSAHRQPSHGLVRARTSADSVNSARVASPTPTPQGLSPPMARSSSLRSKISLSALRSKSSSRDDKADDGIGGSETVQVQDTDFELVRPSASRPRASEDISMNGKALSGGTDGRPSLLRVDSPAASMMSGSASDLRSPVSPSAQGQALPPGAPSAGAVEAHRARELKWVAAMASTPPAQARKSKKVRRLLQEGVPASVRYQVWAHLSDSKAKRIEGLYAQLGERERVRVLGEIQRDAPACFPEDMRLRQPNGPLVSLLNAYLTMVPDIQYSKGLAFIAGQLLLQSPEEDAFWIFISLMDTHLRPYFSSNAIQLEVDATLFAKALEAADSTIAKRLFTGMSIPPIRLCRPWFTSLFVEALPTDYFQRVWDIFLSEGVVFLFRIGLALVACCRRALLDVNTEAEALNILLHPLPSLISSSPDTLIELANSVKLKDDDVRKQRVKMEAQVKRQAQNRLPNSARRSSNTTPASISLPRS